MPSPGVTDAGLPALEVLLGEEADEVLAAFLGPLGGKLRGSRLSQVRYVPGASVTAQYRAEVLWPDGRVTREIVVAGSGLEVPQGVTVIGSDETRIAVWRFPDDPFLPGLAAAVDKERAGDLLISLGADSSDARIRTRAYRAGRRAVVEVTTGSDRLFLKIVRPRRVKALHDRHLALAGAVPVPRSLGWSTDLGVVALQAMPGKTMRKALEGGSRQMPDARQLATLLDRFVDPARGTVAGPVARTGDHAALLSAVLPELAGRIAALVGAIGNPPSADPVAVHGDFHSSQVLLRGGDIVGVVDVDTAGLGQRADDLAGMLGHLATLALASPSRRNIDRYGKELLESFDQDVDADGLRRRTAAVVLGLATGPFRVQQSGWQAETERRISLAESWLAKD